MKRAIPQVLKSLYIRDSEEQSHGQRNSVTLFQQLCDSKQFLQIDLNKEHQNNILLLEHLKESIQRKNKDIKLEYRKIEYLNQCDNKNMKVLSTLQENYKYIQVFSRSKKQETK
ncbi:Hypothetical_protein [Hexamita inflata]|uniref:Hypothetical_protein n=1 Tax=Hexamita inflata TaxID=28002 RepID=A0AA86TZH8_9EUKA|nr:Hypothetical protein HINF_LOCUS23580 [Hexamita inflata]